MTSPPTSRSGVDGGALANSFHHKGLHAFRSRRGRLALRV
jgi:hypothetical protein